MAKNFPLTRGLSKHKCTSLILFCRNDRSIYDVDINNLIRLIYRAYNTSNVENTCSILTSQPIADMIIRWTSLNNILVARIIFLYSYSNRGLESFDSSERNRLRMDQRIVSDIA